MVKVAFNLAWLVVAMLAINIASNYVDQERYENIGARLCDIGMCALVRDSRYNELFWMHVPEAPAKDIITGGIRGDVVRN